MSEWVVMWVRRQVSGLGQPPQHDVTQGKGWCLSAIDRIFGTGISVEKRLYLFSTLDGVFSGYTIMILLSKSATKQYLYLTNFVCYLIFWNIDYCFHCLLNLWSLLTSNPTSIFQIQYIGYTSEI